MIGLHQLTIAVLAGAVLIVFGLVPGLLEGLAVGVRNACDLFCSRPPVLSLPDGQRHRPVWLAGLGALLITVAVLAFLSA